MTDLSNVDVFGERLEGLGEHPDLDPFTDDTPLTCGVENPEGCESCQ